MPYQLALILFLLGFSGSLYCQKAPAHLKYFGFYLVDTKIDDPHDSSSITNYIDEVAPFCNIAHLHVTDYTDNISSNVEKMNSVCVKPFISVQNIFFKKIDSLAPSRNHYALLPDYRRRWQVFKRNNAAVLSAERVGFFYVSDEPTWNGISFNELDAVCKMVKHDFPAIGIMFVEAYISLHKLVIPKTVDWIGFDRYTIFNPSTNTSYLENLATLKSKLSTPAQRMFLTIDDQWLPLFGTLGVTPDSVRAMVEDYYQVAVTEPRISGLVGYLWPGGFDEPKQLGVRDMPQSVIDKNIEIGKKIVANNKICR
jgi:hypothetical protein